MSEEAAAVYDCVEAGLMSDVTPGVLYSEFQAIIGA